MNIRRISLLIFGVVVVCLQGATYWLWSQGALAEFNQVYSSFGIPKPLLTQIVFATWSYWWLAPAICSLLLLGAAMFRQNEPKLMLAAVMMAVFLLCTMWYAMYPIHAMKTGL